MFEGRRGALLLCLIGFVIVYIALGKEIPFLKDKKKNQNSTTQTTIPQEHQQFLEQIQSQKSSVCVACKGKKILALKVKGKKVEVDCLYCQDKNQEALMTTDAVTLCKEYAKNSEKTLQKFGGKKLVISGKIKGLGSIILGKEKRFWFTLEGSESVVLNCKLIPDFEIIKESKGKYVTLVGIVPKEQKKKSEIVVQNCFILKI